MKGKRFSAGKLTGLAAAAAGVAWWLWVGAGRDEATHESDVAAVHSGEFVVRSVYNGKIESRNVVTIMSQFQGVATVVQIAPQGARVERGDLLVQFDASELERELVKLEKEYALAKSDLEGLVKATLPLELQDLEVALLETRSTLQAEQQYLNDSRRLRDEALISTQEVTQQERKVNALRSKLNKLILEHELTREFLHPARLARAQTQALSAEQALNLARRQAAASRITAPTDGVVVYKALNIGGELRTVRVGDNLYPNQPFMVLPDMQDLVVHCDVPESELSRVAVDSEALVRPLAYPALTLPARVETIGSVAQTIPGQPNWQKFFHVTIGIETVDPAVRPGMSVTAHVLSFYRENAILIPRRAVSWDQGRALTRIVQGRSTSVRELTLGMANDGFYEVLDGVVSGDRVVIR